MQRLLWAGLLVLCLLSACQSQSPSTVAIVDGNQLRLLATDENEPAKILAQAGIPLAPEDQVLFNGYPVLRDAALPSLSTATLQIRRAVNVSINGTSHTTTARTVGEASAELKIPLYAADSFSAPASEFITAPLAVNYTPSKELTIRGDGEQVRARSASSTVGAALSEVDLPLLGLDFSKPGEAEALPPDGAIQVVRVSESVVFAEKSIPFQSKVSDSADVELGQQQILQPGLNGLAVSRVRIRYEDGQEVSRQTETETVVRPPQDRIEARGTKIVLKTATVNGVTFQYWAALQMYATVYSPCTSGGANGCSSGTASGLPAGKGVVAVDPGLYAYLNGQHLYIPGYGRAVIGDVGGGYIIEQNLGVSRYRWIDLGFNDNNLVDMSGWVTVYFLAPAPASIPNILK
jgi:resuscitation-promoting factor RpfB